MERYMSAEEGKGSPEKKEHPKKEYHYFVDGKEYKTEDAGLTGAQIKARGGQPDKVIGDNDSVDLNVHPPCHFYTVPPATFGQ
jgi:hypothetical protein